MTKHRSYWALSIEETHGNDTGWIQSRLVVNQHPFVWAREQEATYRLTVRLLHWEKITAEEANLLRDFKDDNTDE